MEERYIVEEHILSEKHPQWPNEPCFKIKDLEKNQYGFAIYTCQAAADRICKEMNMRKKL